MNTEMITDMNTERNYQTKVIYKKGKFIMYDQNYKNQFSDLRKFLMRLCFCADSTQKKLMKHSANYLSLKIVSQPFELMKK